MALPKTALVVCCKREEKRIRKYLDHYRKVARVDRVFICDANEDGYAPDIREKIGPYLRSGFAEYRNFRGAENAAEKCRRELFAALREEFDWICFFDADDYFSPGCFGSLPAFLAQGCFENVDLVRIPEIPGHRGLPVRHDSRETDHRMIVRGRGNQGRSKAADARPKDRVFLKKVPRTAKTDGTGKETVSLRKEPARPDERRLEKLDRGLAAMRTDQGIFVSWRMLSSEDPVFGTAEEPAVYTLLRDGKEIAKLSGKTNYIDQEGRMDSSYSVRAGDGPESCAVSPFPGGKNYFDIPLVRPQAGPCGPYTVSDVGTGDLDGDGAYELVVLWDSGGKDNTEPGRTGNVLLDAYRLDGTRLWADCIDLGPNIRAGAHYTQFLVYDFDRDGRSEILLKTAPGSRDAAGEYVSRASRSRAIRYCDDARDFRDENGMILDGDEFLTVFDGESGRAADTIYYPNQRVAPAVWGDEAGNRSERYTAAVAWLDGEKPYGVFLRGYYWGRTDPRTARQCACAVTFDGKRLRCRHSFDTFDTGSRKGRKRDRSASFTRTGRYKGVAGYRKGAEVYIGEGNHNCAAADVDGDGREEVLTGALCFHLDGKDRLNVKWCSFLGHGDALHLGAYDPDHEGLELFTVQEKGGTHPVTREALDFGMTVLDAGTGKVLFHRGSPGDMGRGMMANVGAGGRYQIWGVSETENEGERVPAGPLMQTEGGFREAQIPGVTCNFRIFWDGDLCDELLDGEKGGPLEIRSWDGSRMTGIFRTEGCVSIHGTKAVPCLSADLLGDWREELVMAREDQEALRVFVSDIPTEYSLKTLMHDPVYRAGVAAQQTGYNQPPHIGFYLGPECFDGGRSRKD